MAYPNEKTIKVIQNAVSHMRDVVIEDLELPYQYTHKVEGYLLDLANEIIEGLTKLE